MASIGTRRNPALARVQTQERAVELLDFCKARGIQAIIELAPAQPEDIADIERALIARQPVPSAPKVGRNEPCPCGSGKKFKKCCDGPQPETAS
jgi:SWIM/SEC-C metal-binding protein